jgi:ubiquinone biosynthesis protein
VWVFDVAWALAVFFGLRSGAARLLAVRIGTPAALGCGALGLGAGLGLQRAVAGDSSGVAPYATFAVLSLLATMALVALLGLIARPQRPSPLGSTRSSLPHPLRAVRLRVARAGRYLGILWLGARYGLGPLTGFRHAREPAEIGAALRDALQDAGGIFVKFGQLLSARTDLVPAAIALELSSLQDDVTPLPTGDVLAVIERELGEPAEELFAAFDQRPLAAASIAQVLAHDAPCAAFVCVCLVGAVGERVGQCGGNRVRRPAIGGHDVKPAQHGSRRRGCSRKGSAGP